MDCSTRSFPVLHYLLEFAQVAWATWAAWRCYLIISSSAPLFFCLQSFPASGSFPMTWLFASGSQRIGASALASVLPTNIQGWFPLGLTSLISLQSKRPSRVFSNTTIQKHQFFSALPFIWSNSHICTWLTEKKFFLYEIGPIAPIGNSSSEAVTPYSNFSSVLRVC